MSETSTSLETCLNYEPSPKSTNRIQIQGHLFRPLYSRDQIQTEVSRVAEEINRDYQDLDLQIIGVMTGCFRFMADLTGQLRLPCQINSFRMKSYCGIERKELTRELEFGFSVTGKHVLIVEDIVDSGTTMDTLCRELWKQKPASIEIATLSWKPKALRYDHIKVKYAAFEMENTAHVVGYGLDVDGVGRNLNQIWQKCDE